MFTLQQEPPLNISLMALIQGRVLVPALKLSPMKDAAGHAALMGMQRLKIMGNSQPC